MYEFRGSNSGVGEGQVSGTVFTFIYIYIYLFIYRHFGIAGSLQHLDTSSLGTTVDFHFSGRWLQGSAYSFA
jgi:hypothetical protein